MAASEEALESCQECGASIYPEHLAKHTADKYHGKLLCPHCLHEKRDADGASPAELRPESLSMTSEPDHATIALAADDGTTDNPVRSEAGKSSSIKSFSGGIATGTKAKEVRFRRPVQQGVSYAIRCRSFHAKLNEASIAYLDRMINEWADAHDEIEIKFATSTIGMFEGKHADPNLIVTVFY